MNYYFVKDGQVIAGKINATNPKESTIMGARVIEARDLTITGDYTMLVPYVYVELKDAIERAKMWTKEKTQLTAYLTNGHPSYAVIDNRVLPVITKGINTDSDGESYACVFIDKNHEPQQITVHADELRHQFNDAFATLTKSLC